MDESHNQLGVHDYDGQTVLNPVGLVAIVVLGMAMLVVPRRYAVWPMIIMGCFVAPAQRIAVFTLNFDMLRIMVIFGTLRIFARHEWSGFQWRSMDSIMSAFAIVGTTVYILQYETLDAVKYKMGEMYDIFGMYFLFRYLVRDREDLARAAFGFAVISVPVAIAFLVERATGRNMFAAFGGVPALTVVRDGRLRCQGAYAHPILAGCYWASLLPLMAALWWRGGSQGWWAASGVICASIIIVLCSSSTPVSAVIFGLLGAGFFVLRRSMRLIRWLMLGTLVSLHLVMKAPVWNLIARVDFTGGSDSWHRYNLINQFVLRFNDWWLLGVRDVESWGIWDGDITNQYCLEAARGGIWALVLFVALIVMAFSGIGRLWRREEGNKAHLYMSWALGVSLFVHCMIFIGVSYFGQITMLWYLTLAMIASLTPESMSQPRIVVIRRQRLRQLARQIPITLSAIRMRERMNGTSPNPATSYLKNNSGHEWADWKRHFGDLFNQSDLVTQSLANVSVARRQIEDAFGQVWHEKKLLDVGAGQLLRQSLIFAMNNSVIGIDLELPFRGTLLHDFITTARTLGGRRAIKTLARQMSGVDRRFQRELCRQSGLARVPGIDLRRMSATSLDFEAASFDGVFSFSVFQHIDRPDLAAREIYRVLRIGGIAYIQLHLYTSLTGSDHPLLRTSPSQVPPWGHLRARTRFFRKHGLYVNELRLSDWRRIFESTFGEVKYYWIDDRSSARDKLKAEIRCELEEYTDEELLTTTVIAVCRKTFRNA